MNKEKQRIAIAKACGWHEEPEPIRSFNPTAWWHNNHRYPSNVMPVPDYCNDLNAMHEAEKVLTKVNWGGYAAELYRITDAHNHGISPNHHWLAVAFSTAAQRAEAFLRTIGKWSID